MQTSIWKEFVFLVSWASVITKLGIALDKDHDLFVLVRWTFWDMSAKCKVHIPESEEMMVEHYRAELTVTLIDVSLQSSHLQQRLWSTDLNF